MRSNITQLRLDHTVSLRYFTRKDYSCNGHESHYLPSKRKCLRDFKWTSYSHIYMDAIIKLNVGSDHGLVRGKIELHLRRARNKLIQ